MNMGAEKDRKAERLMKKQHQEETLQKKEEESRLAKKKMLLNNPAYFNSILQKTPGGGIPETLMG